MLDKLEAIKGRFEQVGMALTNPEIIGNQKEYQKLSKEYRSLENIVIPFEEYKKVLTDFDFAKDALNSNDEEMRELAKMDLPDPRGPATAINSPARKSAEKSSISGIPISNLKCTFSK